MASMKLLSFGPFPLFNHSAMFLLVAVFIQLHTSAPLAHLDKTGLHIKFLFGHFLKVFNFEVATLMQTCMSGTSKHETFSEEEEVWRHLMDEVLVESVHPSQNMINQLLPVRGLEVMKRGGKKIRFHRCFMNPVACF